MMNTTVHTEDITECQREFLIREFGDKYIDLIEMEWEMGVEEFCKEYLEWDDNNRRWTSLI